MRGWLAHSRDSEILSFYSLCLSLFLSLSLSLSLVGSESAGKPFRSVACRDDARTGASSGYSRLAPAIEARGEGGASGGDNAFKRAAMV